jgi:uncharacterized protein (TIGR02598 family)
MSGSSRHNEPACPGRPAAAFSLLEVVLAAFVLAVGILTSIAVLQRGFQALDTARNLTTATQVMQSEMERLRLKNWAQLQELQDSRDTAVPLDRNLAGTTLSCTRTITDYKAGMKQIVLTSSWQGHDGRQHTVRMVTRYCRDGLNDYYYTVH